MARRSWVAQLVSAAAKDWWIVAVCVAAAVAVGAGARLASGTTYEASATIAVDATTIAANSRLPKPDIVVGESQRTSFVQDLAGKTGRDRDELRRGLKVFTTGNPQNSVIVRFTSSDEDVATKVARAAAELLLERADVLLKPELDRQKALVSESRRALAVLENAEDQVAVAADLWTIRRNNILDQLNLANTERCYSYDGDTTVEVTSRRSKVLSGGAAGLLLGAVAGVLLVAARDSVRRRADAPSA